MTTQYSSKNYANILTPNGADDITCPYCYHMMKFNTNIEYKNDYINFDGQICTYCFKLFGISHVCIKGGCTESEYSAYIVTKYKTDDKIYEGSPKLNEYKTIEVIELTCTCSDEKCLGKLKVNIKLNINVL